ncbi:hypothetical protein [Bacillus manliponensis]|uniref:hypothetical protein n=1 Tax=Bacillus manliponensis TaxID=574376 RepID=UPI0006911297|nr:hypothetical protein [Bacillus manliponensis]
MTVLSAEKTNPLQVSLYKKESGFVFKDEFQTMHPDWILSPIGSVNIAARNGYLRLEHNENTDVLALLEKPDSDIAIQVVSEYSPTAAGDEGGLILFENDDNKVEFLEAFSAVSNVDSKEWLAVSKGDQWNFFSKKESGFEFENSERIHANKIGIVLKKGINKDFVNLDINKVIVTKGNKLKLRQAFPKSQVILKDAVGLTIFHGLIEELHTGIDIPLPSLEFEGSLQILDNYGNLIAEKSALFHGGDIYNLGSPLKIYMNTAELSDTSITDLGYMTEGERLVKMTIANENFTAATNLYISVQQYLDKAGYTWADISFDGSAYGDQLYIGTLEAQTTKDFFVKVTKDYDYIGFEPIYFNIKLKHD